MLMGEEDSQHQNLLLSARFMFGCLAKALKDRALGRQAVTTALASGSLKPFLEHLTGQQLAWLQRHMQLTADSSPNEVGHPPCMPKCTFHYITLSTETWKAVSGFTPLTPPADVEQSR